MFMAHQTLLFNVPFPAQNSFYCEMFLYHILHGFFHKMSAARGVRHLHNNAFCNTTYGKPLTIGMHIKLLNNSALFQNTLISHSRYKYSTV